jgi:hypothetical protein
MSGEIDFSLISGALRRRWWIILLSLAVALALGVGIGLLQGRRYEASNVLLVQSPRYQWRFVGEITAITNQSRDFQREVLAIARSDEIAQAAAAALPSSVQAEGVGPQALQEAIAVRAGDGNTIVVVATAADSDQAAAIARAWTQALIDAGRDVYGMVEDLASFEAELRRLERDLLEKEAALAAVRARTGLFSNANMPDEVMGASLSLQEVNRLTEKLAEYTLAVQHVNTLQGQLAAAAPDSDLTQLPWELLAGPPFDERAILTAEIARASLDEPARLLTLLQQEQGALQATADTLASQAEQLRTAMAADWEEYSNVGRELNQARDLYQIMLRKVNELRLQELLDPSLLTPVGSADPLISHVRAPMLGLLATAAVAGLIVGFLAAVLVEYAQRKKTMVSR